MKVETAHALAVLKRGGLILYPTDTVWGIGCDATNPAAVEKVYKLKNRNDSKALICLVHDFKMLAQYVENVPKIAYDIVKYAVRPTTIIYDNPVHVASNLVAADNSLGIRVVKDSFCCQLLQKLKRPLVSTSANVSGESAPGRFSEVSNTILKGVDYVVPLRQNKKGSPPSALIKLKNNGRVSVLRE